MRALGFVILAVAIAGGGGYWLGGRPVPPRAPVAERRPVREDRGLSEAELRRVIRDELEARAVRAPSEAPATHEVVPDLSARPETAAFDAGKRRVDDALARHTWTQQDALALAPDLAAMSADQRKTVLSTLVPALNRGQVKLTYRGPMFF